VGGLAHYFEEEGIPTTQISLIREHTQTIRPPRALWVPFEFGRPLGLPNNEKFQIRVLEAALKLFEAKKGPVLKEFPEDAPVLGSGDADAVWACPINLSLKDADLSKTDQLREAFKREMAQLRSWYDLEVKKRGRSIVGVSGLDLEMISDFVGSFIDGDLPDNPRKDIPLAMTLKLTVDDLKAYYFEAVSSQPGQESPTGKAIVDWFWSDTIAAKVLYAVKDSCVNSDVDELRMICKFFLIPMLHNYGNK